MLVKLRQNYLFLTPTRSNVFHVYSHDEDLRRMLTVLAQAGVTTRLSEVFLFY